MTTGIYFSGTGNTEHCLKHFLQLLDEDALSYPVESDSAAGAVKTADVIVFAYPVYYSYLPKIVNDFIVANAALWRGKRIFIIATMGLFSGDGAGCAARLFKKYGAKVLGGLHLKMPDCIGDVKLLKKSQKENCEIVARADKKIEKTVTGISFGRYPKDGLSFAHRLAGLFGQRLYFRGKTRKYYSGIKVDPSKCVGCGTCVSICPMKNIGLIGGVISFNERCTMCYRCFSHCPGQAITVIGKRVVMQCKFDNYRPQ